jgi:hypothetical protein
MDMVEYIILISVLSLIIGGMLFFLIYMLCMSTIGAHLRWKKRMKCWSKEPATIETLINDNGDIEYRLTLYYPTIDGDGNYIDWNESIGTWKSKEKAADYAKKNIEEYISKANSKRKHVIYSDVIYPSDIELEEIPSKTESQKEKMTYEKG